jgi:type 1 glutamine amidotransferase
MQGAIVFTGGVGHPFDTSAPALGEILREAGFEPRISLDIGEIVEWMRADAQALLVVYALRWSMSQHEKYAPLRRQWAFTLPDDARGLIKSRIAAGAGLLGVHTASICFDDWSEWAGVLGGAWEWGKSHHPPLGPVVAAVDTQHFLTTGLTDFSLIDEVYSDQILSPDISVCARAHAAEQGSSFSDGQPVCWTHHYGRGRVVYDALGHDAPALNQPVHRRLLQRAALWAAGAHPGP